MSRWCRAARVVAATASLLAIASAARAMSGQHCAPQDLVPVDTWIAEHLWHVGPMIAPEAPVKR